MKAGESLPDEGSQEAPSAPGSTALGTEIAAMERRGACTLRKGCARRKAWTKMLRLAALHPLGIGWGPGKGRRPARGLKEYGR